MCARSHSTSTDGLACPSCGRRYALDERFCDVCGMPLVHGGPARVEEPRNEAHERARKIRPEYTRGELVRVAGGRNQAEAELIQGLLLEEGVPSMLRRTAGFDVPDFLAAGPRDVMVPESGAARAHETLNDAQLGAAAFEEQSFRSRAVRIFAGLLLVGFAGVLLALVLFQAAK
ncbi:MAG TPA: hypothetical protein VF517_03780 [Thermoleophilaceae bacterium]|jgi:pimeloyl-ACP methyl ester carboxylesterase